MDGEPIFTSFDSETTFIKIQLHLQLSGIQTRSEPARSCRRRLRFNQAVVSQSVTQRKHKPEFMSEILQQLHIFQSFVAWKQSALL